ncbi:MAG: alpha/beta hydrolase [Ignavibacteriales bacterium]|nr:alpha/beta hydrolase [Ignavibacteriales bacterium]
MKICLSLLTVISFVLFTNGRVYTQDVPAPDSSDAKYGQHALNNYDFWKAASNTPTPLVIYIHGGSFRSGDKSKVSAPMIQGLLKTGISFMAINYRLTPEVSFPQHYYDCARAIQYVRYYAKEFNVDPDKIALTGSSAGGCTSLWLAFHDDLADINNEDPVLKMSTRVSCATVFSGQSTLEPDVIREIVGELALGNSMFNGKYLGIDSAELNTQKAKDLYKQASPVTYLTKDDPAVWAYYSAPKTTPTIVNEAIHHYNFGLYLKDKMDKLGMECELLDKESGVSATKSAIAFYKRHFTMKE